MTEQLQVLLIKRLADGVQVALRQPVWVKRNVNFKRLPAIAHIRRKLQAIG
jgi:hypothetical protein